MAHRESPNISLRIPSPTFHKLASNAAAVGMTPGLYAKRLLIERLENHDVLEVLGRLEEFDAELALLRQDIAAVLEALLLNLPNAPFSKEQVREFVTRKLKPRRGDRGA